MFKQGEKIVFIDDYSLFEDEREYLSELKLNHIYTVKYGMTHYSQKQNYGKIICLMENSNYYYSYRFISLKNFRKRKLSKISSKL